AADGQAARDPGDPKADRPQQLGEVDRRGLALDARVRGEDDLLDAAAVEARQELAHLEVLRPDAVERGERAEEHVIAPAELAGALEGQEIVGLFHDTEGAALPRRIAADPAGILLGDVEAHRAVEDPRLELRQRLGELSDLVRRSLEKEEGEALRRLRPDAGQLLERFDEPRDGLGIVRHHAYAITCRGRGSSGPTRACRSRPAPSPWTSGAPRCTRRARDPRASARPRG